MDKKHNLHLKKVCLILGGQSALARSLKVSCPTVNQWINGVRPIPAKQCPLIEKLVSGKVKCEQLRPDIEWSYLRGSQKEEIETHHVYAEELDLIATMADTDAIANYFAEQRGLMCIHKPNFDGLSDKAILELFLIHQEQLGKWSLKIREAMDDGDIDWDEFVAIQKEYNEFVVAGAEIMNRIQCFMASSEERKSRAKKK